MDGVKALLKGKNRDVAEMAKKVTKKLKEDVEKKSLKIVSNGEWEGMKEQDDCVLWLLGGRAASMQQGRRSGVGRQRGNAGSRLEKKSQQVRSERRSEKKEVQSEILGYQEE